MTLLGTAFFAAALALGQLVYESGHTVLTLQRLAVLVSLLGLPGLALGLSQDDVAAGLVIDGIAAPAKGLDGFLPRAHRQTIHGRTSTISSVMGSGTGSPCFSKLAM